MKILITGICGFVGSALACELKAQNDDLELYGLDNLSRPGSEINRNKLQRLGVKFFHADIRLSSDIEMLPKVDWVIEAAANPSVLAGVSGQTSSRQLVEHNLGGTIQILEYCKRHQAGLIMLSTSRVYSLNELCALPVLDRDGAFILDASRISSPGATGQGISEKFSTTPPLSLYGTAKLASELVILEYAAAFGFPVHLNRCGVLAGAGQFGKPDQGIFSYWIHSWKRKRALKYIGFGGTGHQVRDCLHPGDLASLVRKQIRRPEQGGKVLNVSGGLENSMSLLQLSKWCASRFGNHEVTAEPALRRYDVPWLVLDSACATAEWGWRPARKLLGILEEIANHAEEHPDWLDISNAS